MSENEKQSWFDTRMTIGNLITIAVVVGGLIAGWFKFGERVSLLEQAQQRTEVVIERLDRERDDVKIRVIRIEEKISGQNDTLQRILRSVEK